MSGQQAQIGLRLEQELADALDRAREEQSRSAWIRDLIERELGGVAHSAAKESVPTSAGVNSRPTDGEREVRDSAADTDNPRDRITTEQMVREQIHKLNSSRPSWSPQMRREKAKLIVSELQASGLPVRIGDEAGS